MNALIQMDYSVIISLVFDGDILFNTSFCWLTVWYRNGTMWVSFLMYVGLFDFTQAIDVVSHHLLLDKLRLLDICSLLIDWIVDFLIGLVMRVSVSIIRSNFMDVRSDVPQGSVLGPLLFLLLLIIYLLMLFLNISFLWMI